MEFLKFCVLAMRRWFRHDGPGQAAAVSFYAIFAMAPMLVFAVVGASKALGPEKAKDAAVNWLADMVPLETAESLVSVVQVKLLADGPWWSSVVSGGVLVWAASLVFVRLAFGTHRLFGETTEAPRGVLRKNLFGRLIALSFAVAVGLLIIVVLVLSSLLAPVLRAWPDGTLFLLGAGNALLLAIGGVVLLRVLSRDRPRRRALLVAGLFYGIGFLVGRVLFQSYVSHSAIATAYGVASSVVVFLVWIYYLSCGYFIGAAICAELSARRVPDP